MYTKQQSRLGVVITLALALAFIFSPVAWTNVVPATHAASREPVRAEHGIVASTNEVASRVGVDIMKRGGNAIDAAIAVAFALAVTHPAAGNLGGGGFMMIRLKDGKTTAIDYREMAPAAATHNIYLDQNGNLISGEGGSLVGYRAAGVPGTVRGMELAFKKYGSHKLSWSQLMSPLAPSPMVFMLPTRWRDHCAEATITWRSIPKRNGSISTMGSFTTRAIYFASRIWLRLLLAYNAPAPTNSTRDRRRE